MRKYIRVIQSMTKVLIQTLELNSNSMTPVVSFLLVKKMKLLIERSIRLGCTNDLMKVARKIEAKILEYYKVIRPSVAALIKKGFLSPTDPALNQELKSEEISPEYYQKSLIRYVEKLFEKQNSDKAGKEKCQRHINDLLDTLLPQSESTRNQIN